MEVVPSGQKRKSRFDNDVPSSSSSSTNEQPNQQPPTKRPNTIDITDAAARAAEISKTLSSKMAMVSSLLNSVTDSKLSFFGHDRKAAYRPLLLDAQGREIDEYGNLVRHNLSNIKTLAANVAIEKGLKKKNNPYLSHKEKIKPEKSGTESVINPSLLASMEPISTTSTSISSVIVDERLPTSHKRDMRAKKALTFVGAGKYLKEADELKEKEERKIIAGYASGRKALQNSSGESMIHDEVDDVNMDKELNENGAMATVSFPNQEAGKVISTVSVPPPIDANPANHPDIEWWDEAFLSKSLRESRKKAKANPNTFSMSTVPIESIQDNQTEFSTDIFYKNLVSLNHVKTHRYVQHPAPFKQLGVNATTETVNLPMYLTKKERKKLRKAVRAEREKEKRDKMMMGLIPPPEPKFKLSNFMKILGDQAVADPSKVEMRVLQQMQQRVINHKMRNLAAKLTPSERKEKKIRKLHEDTSKVVHIAVFRVKEFSNLKHRFKVDVNAQQHFLTGVVLLCQSEGHNLVVVEGGPKGIRKFIKLMTHRICWTDVPPPSFQNVSLAAIHSTTTSFPLEENESKERPEDEGVKDSNDHLKAGYVEEEPEDDDDEDQKDALSIDDNLVNPVDGEKRSAGGKSKDEKATIEAPQPVINLEAIANNRCDLLWTGTLAKRTFTGFKFQECRNSPAAKKMLAAKGVGHYWDMVVHADESMNSQKHFLDI